WFPPELFGGALDRRLERQVLERVQRVVVDEDADRPLRRQQVREPIDRAGQGMVRGAGVVEHLPCQYNNITILCNTNDWEQSAEARCTPGRRRAPDLQGAVLPGPGASDQDQNAGDSRARRTHGPGTAGGLDPGSADRLSAVSRASQPGYRVRAEG